MGEPVAFMAHPLAESLKSTQLGDKGLEEGTDGRNIPKAKLSFNLPKGRDDAAQRFKTAKWHIGLNHLGHVAPMFRSHVPHGIQLKPKVKGHVAPMLKPHMSHGT